MTRKSTSNAKSLQEKNDSLKREKKSLKDEFGRIATALKSHDSSRGSHKQHPQMEKYKPKLTSHHEITLRKKHSTVRHHLQPRCTDTQRDPNEELVFDH